MRRALCENWLEVAPPLPWSSVWGAELGPVCRLCGDSRGYRLDLANGRYSCQSCQYGWTREHAAHTPSCTDVCAYIHTRRPKCHLNYGGMLYKISGKYLGNLLRLQSSFSLLTPSMPQCRATFWLFPKQHKRGGLTCLPTRVWHYCVVFFPKPDWKNFFCSE